MKTLFALLWMGTLFAQAPVPDDARLAAVEGTNYAYPMPHYSTLDQWKQRREHLRKQVLAAAGLLPLPRRGPVHAEVFGKLDREGYSIEKVFVETLPGYYLCGNLYRPRGKQGKFPGIVSPHGHWKSGRIEDTEVGSIPARCINLARQGYVVFAYDMVGYNDTKQTPHVFGGPKEDLHNFGPLSLQLWNSIRALDFVESLPDVDKERLGATGASGGGTQTFLLTAVDDRIKAAAPVNMISGIMQGGSPCENAPGLRHDTFNVDIGAMMAPRPLLLVAATGDWTKNVPRVEFPAIRQIFSLYDASSRVSAVQFDAPHNYNRDSREAVYTFFARQFQGSTADKVVEQPYKMEAPNDLLVWAGRELPAGALDLGGVFEAWKRMTRLTQPDREAMRFALSVSNPKSVQAAISGDRVTLSRPGVRDVVRALWRPGTGSPLLVVHPEGSEAGRKAVPAEGRPILSIDVWKGGRNTSARHFYTFHRTDAQNRVQDILTALAWLRTQSLGQVEIRGVGEAGVWALFAAAAAEGDIRLTKDVHDFTGSDDEFVKRFYVPGIQRVGGLAAAAELAEKR